jgi:hypothetical protein
VSGMKFEYIYEYINNIWRKLKMEGRFAPADLSDIVGGGFWGQLGGLDPELYIRGPIDNMTGLTPCRQCQRS